MSTVLEEIDIHATRHAADKESDHVLRSGHATQFFPDRTWACADGYDCEVPSLEELECCVQQHDPQLSCEEARAETRAR